MAPSARLVAQPIPEAVPLSPLHAPIRAVLASLARGGAERIVLDWLSAEARRGRDVELALLHSRATEYPVPDGIAVLRRSPSRDLAGFADELAIRWQGHAAPVAVHLAPDEFIERLAGRGLAPIPVLHNTREGWRNDPASWRPGAVPLAIACAEVVRREALEAGCVVPLATVRHAPAIGAAAFDPEARRRVRETLGIGESTLLVGMVGALKAQKDYGRALEVLAAVRERRDAVLCILGGVLDGAGLAQLDALAGELAGKGLAPFVRLPGAVDPVEPWLAAFDALLNTSRHEGLSMATREALAAGLPVVATAVGGQGEIAHPRLSLLAPEAAPADFAKVLSGLPVRAALERESSPRYPRAWSVPLGLRRSSGPRLATLLATANLNAGGAQRSLVNLARALAPRHRLAVAVCGETTHPAFPAALRESGIESFRVAADADPFAVAEGLLAAATSRGARTLCFWNLDSRVKLLVARFAPTSLRLVDASPGAYGWREMAAASAALADTLAFGAGDYHARLDALVTKFVDPEAPAAVSRAIIPNGVAIPAFTTPRPAEPRFLVRGRIAPSKRIGTILEAFRMFVASHPRARLAVAGQAEPRDAAHAESLREAAADLPIDWLGARPDEALLAEPFTAAIVLGTHQGSPNAVLEALAAGLPVIANASGGTGEIVRGGRTGWLLPEDPSPGDLVRAMDEAACRDDLASRFAQEGRTFVREHHSLDVMALRYLSLFDPDGTRVPETDRLGYPELRPA